MSSEKQTNWLELLNTVPRLSHTALHLISSNAIWSKVLHWKRLHIVHRSCDKSCELPGKAAWLSSIICRFKINERKYIENWWDPIYCDAPNDQFETICNSLSCEFRVSSLLFNLQNYQKSPIAPKIAKFEFKNSFEWKCFAQNTFLQNWSIWQVNKCYIFQ